MSSPYVCAVCGQPITIGRHKSGWRHSSDKRSDHRVKPIHRNEYVPASTSYDTAVKKNMLKSSELNTLLSNSNSSIKLRESIKNDIKDFKRGLAEKGRSAPVKLQNEGKSFTVTRNEILNLCNWYLENEIDAIELEYIANLLELSEDFKYEDNISEELFLLSSPEINGKINKSIVQNIINRL
jgi:hypothetical protein